MVEIIEISDARDRSLRTIAQQNIITASDAGAILGLSKYRTAKDVMDRKLGLVPRQPANKYTDWGRLHEDEAIESLIDLMDLPDGYIRQCGLFIADDWIGAIPDGLAGRNGVLEIKCPMSRAKTNVFPPVSDEYHAQAQIEMYCTDRKFCLFYQWSPLGGRLDTITRNEQWLGINIPILKAFHAEMMDHLFAGELP